MGRRNPSNGKLVVALRPSPQPRTPLADAVSNIGSVCEGVVYYVQNERVYIDFGCEVSGFVARSQLPPDVVVGQSLQVMLMSLDIAKGHFVLSHRGDLQDNLGHHLNEQ